MYQQSPKEKPKGVGRFLKALGGDVLFSSILPAAGNDTNRKSGSSLSRSGSENGSILWVWTTG